MTFAPTRLAGISDIFNASDIYLPGKSAVFLAQVDVGYSSGVYYDFGFKLIDDPAYILLLRQINLPVRENLLVENRLLFQRNEQKRVIAARENIHYFLSEESVAPCNKNAFHILPQRIFQDDRDVGFFVAVFYNDGG